MKTCQGKQNPKMFLPRDKEVCFNGQCSLNSKLLFDLIRPVQTDNTTLHLTHSTNVPKRKHRKRRINKKWLKRYGYKEVTTTLSGTISAKKDGNDQFTFTVDNMG